MDNRPVDNVKKLSLSGILLALTVITLLVESFAPTGRLSLYALSSFFVSVIVLEFGIGAGWVFYIASAVLAFVVLPNKLETLPFILFFGVYGLIKYHIERLRNIFVEYALKLAFFGLVLAAAILFVREFLLSMTELSLPWGALIALAVAVFLVYDYVTPCSSGITGKNSKES